MKTNLPAFLFYANDFIGSTAHLEVEVVGAYIRLLCYQWVNGSIPKNPKYIQAIISCSASKFKEIWEDLSPKFKNCADGLKNERLESVRKEALEYKDSISKRGQEAAKARWNKQCTGNAQAMPTHDFGNAKPMPKNALSSSSSSSSSLSISSSNNGRGAFRPPTLPEVRGYCLDQGFRMSPEQFFDHFQSNGWKVGGKAPMKDWKAAVRNWERREGSRPGHVDKSHITHQRAKALSEKVNALIGAVA